MPFSDQQRKALAWEWENHPEKRPQLEALLQQQQSAPQTPSPPPQTPQYGERGLPDWAPDVGTMAGNIGPSLGQLAKDVTAPIHSPVDTAKGLWKLGTGAVQKLIPGRQGNEEAVEGLARAMKDRYGGVSAIRNTLEQDPAGLAFDVGSLATGGAGMAAKGGKVGKLAAALSPTAAASSVVTKAGAALPHILGFTTGAKARPIQVAFEAGAEGGSRGRMFLDTMDGKIPMENVVAEAKNALGAMRQVKSEAFRKKRGEVFEAGGDKPLDLDAVVARIREDSPSGTYKGRTIDPETVRVRGDIDQALEAWSGLSTVEDMDALRQAVGAVRDSTQPHTQARVAADKAYHAIRDEITKQDPEYGRMLSDYAAASDEISNIEKALSLGEKAAVETGLRKLQSIVRNDVSSAYGQRGRYADRLKEHGADRIEDMIGASALNSWTPRGVQPVLAGGAVGTGLLTGASLPAVAAALPAMSPKAVGKAAFRLGQGTKKMTPLTDFFARYGDPTIYGAGQAGRAREGR